MCLLNLKAFALKKRVFRHFCPKFTVRGFLMDQSLLGDSAQAHSHHCNYFLKTLSYLFKI